MQDLYLNLAFFFAMCYNDKAKQVMTCRDFTDLHLKQLKKFPAEFVAGFFVSSFFLTVCTKCYSVVVTDFEQFVTKDKTKVIYTEK